MTMRIPYLEDNFVEATVVDKIFGLQVWMAFVLQHHGHVLFGVRDDLWEKHGKSM